MIHLLGLTVGLLLQANGAPHTARAVRAPDPVGVWRTDSNVYIKLRESGYVVLLHVDAIGRIRILFPLAPDAGTAMSPDSAIALAVPPEAQGNPATFVAVRSHWPFDFAAVRAGAAWDYQDALLLKPTAGDPLAALLDIADRITDGRPYEYGGVRYARDGRVAALGEPLQPTVCLRCVRPAVPVAAAAAVPSQANNVDCSNASLTNSFCGVANSNVSITSYPQVAYQPPPAPAVEPVYVPYYLPIVVGGLRGPFVPPATPRPAPQVIRSVASPVAPRFVVPSSGQLRTFTGRRP